MPDKILGRHSTKIYDFLAMIQSVFLLSFSQMINSLKAEIWLKHGQNIFLLCFPLFGVGLVSAIFQLFTKNAHIEEGGRNPN